MCNCKSYGKGKQLKDYCSKLFAKVSLFHITCNMILELLPRSGVCSLIPFESELASVLALTNQIS
jgi:hypothetical protein